MPTLEKDTQKLETSASSKPLTRIPEAHLALGPSEVPKSGGGGWRLRLSVEETLEILTDYRGNGGELSLYSLCKRHKLPCNAVYTLLRQPRWSILKKAAEGKYLG